MTKRKAQMNERPVAMEEYDRLRVQPNSCDINGNEIDADQYERIYQWIEGDLLILRECPFCSTPLLTAKSIKTSDEIFREVDQLSYLWSCPNCAYWHWYNRDAIDFYSDTYELVEESLYSTACISKMRSFEAVLPGGCEKELAIAFRRDSRLWHTIDPYKFESFIGALFKANFAQCEVMHVGRSGDGGVDLIFIDSDQNQWLIQVKRRESPNSSEGVSTIRNLLGALFLRDSLQGIVVSTADHFTFRAYQAVTQAKRLGRTVRLIDRGRLSRMLNPLIPDRPWRQVIGSEARDLTPTLDPTRDFTRQIRRSGSRRLTF